MAQQDATIDCERYDSGKRVPELTWKEYFMTAALLATKRSKDPTKQIGACIVSEDKRIMGIGYNGMPTGCADTIFPWKTTSERLENAHLYVCHAGLNAVLFKNSNDVKNCTIYITVFPCNECAKAIIQSGIKTVVYMPDTDEPEDGTDAADRRNAAVTMFDAAGVTHKFELASLNTVTIAYVQVIEDIDHTTRPSLVPLGRPAPTAKLHQV